MSSYRGESDAWDGGPPGAEADYAPQRAPPHAAPLPTTDPWTGVSYSQYGQPYDYQAYGASGYGYNYDASYYQRDSGYYDSSRSSYPQQQSSYDYGRPYDDSNASRGPPRDGFDRSRRSYDRSGSPYIKQEREYSRHKEASYENSRRQKSRSTSKPRRRKYSSSDRSSSRSGSYTRVTVKKEKRSASSASSESNRSYKKVSLSRRDNISRTPPPKGKSSHLRNSKSPSGNYYDKSKQLKVKREIDSEERKIIRSKQSRERRPREVRTPPSKTTKTASPKRYKSTDRSSVTPPRAYKRSVTPQKKKSKSLASKTPPRHPRDTSVTPPRSYAKAHSVSRSKSHSSSYTPPRKHKKSRRSKSRSRSYSSSSHSTRSSRSRSKSSRSIKKSKHPSKSRSRDRRSSSRYKNRRLRSPDSRSRSKSRSSRSRSRSDSGSDDERRGQFTVADRKRFWKMHRSKQGEKEAKKSPPKELKPPPGAIESTAVDDIEYGDPPEVEGPNFAELLPTPEQVLQTASTSKSKPGPIPIKNDGSFLEMFKKMQEETKKVEPSEQKPVMKKPVLPFIGKRRGGRVLKTGLVKKAKAIDEQPADAPKDAWSLYMQEVKKYRETSLNMPAMLKSAEDLKTAPFDPRFPNQNQTRHCYQSYLDFHRCQKVRGEKYDPCNYFKRVYTSLCPNEWVQKWDDQREAGTFPGKI